MVEMLIQFVPLLIYLAILTAMGVAVAKILKRLGFSRWWTILAFVPIVNIVALWMLSNAKWPSETQARFD